MLGMKLVNQLDIAKIEADRDMYKEAFKHATKRISEIVDESMKSSQIMSHTLMLLGRIREQYPYVFNECITVDDLKKILEI